MQNTGFSKQATLKNNQTVKYKLSSRDAAILYPSLGCPALVKIDENNKAWLEVIIIAKSDKVKPMHVAFQLRYSFWEDNFKNVRNYNKLRIWEYFKRPYTMEGLAPINGLEDIVKIDGPVEVSNYLDANAPGSLDKDDTFNLKFAHTNIFPWVLESYKEIGYSYLYKIAVNLGYEEAASINGKLLNFIWIEEELFNNAKSKPYLTREYAKSTRENITSDYKSKLSDFDPKVEYEDDFFFTKYHPVYVSDKNYLDIGHITDIHLDNRLDLVYGQSVASVVEVKENNKLELDDKNKNRVVNERHKHMCRPLKNIVANFNKIFEDISKKLSKKSDLLVITGDLIDYNRGLQTSQTSEEKAKKPGEVWDELKASWHRVDSENHKQDINWKVFRERLLKLYNEYKKPVFTLLGNHDYVGYAMAPWPLFGLLWEGVYHMNMTRYEAALCFGPGYNQSKQFMADYFSGVDTDYIKWYSYFINPFPDMVVNYGDQSLFLVDWALDSTLASNKLEESDASELHRAVNIFDYRSPRDPFPIHNYAIYQSWKSSNAKIKILCMHPTAICPNNDISTGEATFDYTWEDEELKHGTFHTRREEILKDVENGDLNIVLTGHSHRNMIFELKPEHNGYPLPLASKREPKTDYMKPRNLVAVTPSAGPMSTYLPGGPLICGCRYKYDSGFFSERSYNSLSPNLYKYEETQSESSLISQESRARAHYLKSRLQENACPNCGMHVNDMVRKPPKHHRPGGNLLLFDEEGNVKFKTESSDLKTTEPRKAVFCEQNDIFTGDMKLEDIGSKEEFNKTPPKEPIDIVSRDSFTFYGYMEFPSKVQYITYQEGLLYSEELESDRYNVKTDDCEDGYTIVRQQIGKKMFEHLKRSARNESSFAFTRYYFTSEVWDREIIMTKSFFTRLKDEVLDNENQPNSIIGGAQAPQQSSGEQSGYDPDPYEGLLIQFKTVPDFKKRRDICGY